MPSASESFFPSNAKRAYHGKIFDVWEWEQLLFDGTTATFEGLKRRHTAKVLATVDGKIMVTDEEQPVTGRYRSFPGGMIDDGKTPLEQAQEELLGETGYASDDWELWESIRTFRTTDYTVHYFVARNCRKVAEPTPEPGEKIGVGFLSFDELLLLSDDREFIGAEFVNRLLRMRIHEEEREAFRKFLFK